jgi:uncharacterized integral membrane protein
MTTMPPSPYAYNYKRRRPSIVRNLWIYRRMVLLAMLLGVFLWFIVINNTPVTVYLPFGLGQLATRSGVAVLLGAVAGSLATALGFTIFRALRHHRLRTAEPVPSPAAPPGAPAKFDDPTGKRPPADYAARTQDGFPDAPWSAR